MPFAEKPLQALPRIYERKQQAFKMCHMQYSIAISPPAGPAEATNTKSRNLPQAASAACELMSELHIIPT